MPVREMKPTTTPQTQRPFSVLSRPKVDDKTPAIVRDVLERPYVDMERRAQFKKADQLALPADPAAPTKVDRVALPADGTANPAQDFVVRAAMQLGFSEEVAKAAVARMAQQSGDQLVVDKDTKAPLTTVEAFKKADNDGDGTDAYTFDAAQIALLKDTNDAFGLGLGSVEELYARQGTQFDELQAAALAGTDVDMNKALQSIHDPAVRDAMVRSYEALRGVDDLAQGRSGSVEALGALKEMLDESLAKLPKDHPLAARVLAARDRVIGAERLLLSTPGGGVASKETMAALVNLARTPLGKVPDEAQFSAMVENAVSDAQGKGATPEQASALRSALETAYVIRAGQTTSADGLQRANAELKRALDAAGRFAPKEVRGLVNEAAVRGTVDASSRTSVTNGTSDATTNGARNAEEIAAISEALKLYAAGRDFGPGAEAFDAIKSAAEAYEKNGTWEGALAGGTSASAIVKSILEMAKELPEVAPQAAKLLEKMAIGVKLPADVLGAVSNGYKVLAGKDFEGKPLSTDDRIKAGVDLGLDNAPSIVTGIGLLSGAQWAAAAAPPLAIAYGQAKLMMMTLEEVGKMKGAIYEHELRERFGIKQGETLDAGLQRVANKAASGDVTRVANAERTAQALLTSGFENSDTMARFRAYASQRLGRENVDALMRGRRIPGPWDEKGINNPDQLRAAKTIELAKDLQMLVGEFLGRESADARRMLNQVGGDNSRGQYLDAKERNYRLPR